MALIAMGGGSGAVAASAHASCDRFRGTDPLITKQPRRDLARALPVVGDLGGIPLARWIRAMTFESLIRNEAFASKIATTTIGNLNLERPAAVFIADGKGKVDETLTQLGAARDRARKSNVASLIHTTAVPHPGFNAQEATTVLPDFLIIARDSNDTDDAWVIAGDAKDYERVRSRVDDGRMLKGFVQVAFGAEALQQWAELPVGLKIHDHGVLAVPRNSFLQPMAVTEDLRDHRVEVQMRLLERLEEAQKLNWTGDAEGFVSHLTAAFNPATCSTCPLFAYCRNELRVSTKPEDFLVELGISKQHHSALIGFVDGTGEASVGASPALVNQILATRLGYSQRTGQNRVDVIGEPGTVNVVVAKSDAAALGVHGIGIQVVNDSGIDDWKFEVFPVPQSDQTRRSIMGLIGKALDKALSVTNEQNQDERKPIHLVVPDAATGDLLASIADSLAGVEISRLRWEHDVAQGREPLTFDGNPATIPNPITQEERLGVSFLLEDDRARAFSVRFPIVDAREALNRVFSAGGPTTNFGRLDYLVSWANASAEAPLNARNFADLVEASLQTPGARLTNKLSDRINESLGGGKKPADMGSYEAQVLEELEFKAQVLNAAKVALDRIPSSSLRDAYRAIEGDAQKIWRRRLELQAHDLIRFSSTHRSWRNSLVKVIEDDALCHAQLMALTIPTWAQERANDAGFRDVANATVIGTKPLVVEVDSRRITAGNRIVLLHVNGHSCVEQPNIKTKMYKGHVKITGLPAGELLSTDAPDTPRNHLILASDQHYDLNLGDEIVIANFDWFTKKAGMGSINVNRPKLDEQLAPKESCTPESFELRPEEHRWCCQPHVAREAEISDLMAKRRSDGQLNPQAWPPVMDQDSFDVAAPGEATADNVYRANVNIPGSATLDDLD